MRTGLIITTLLVLLLATDGSAAPGPERTWGHGWRARGGWFGNGYAWRYRGNRVGVRGGPGQYYRPWSVKRREFHNSSDEFSHRYYR